MNQSALAKSAGLGLSTIVDFEKERRQVSEDAVLAIEAAFERAGIEFIAENGEGEASACEEHCDHRENEHKAQSKPPKRRSSQG